VVAVVGALVAIELLSGSASAEREAPPLPKTTLTGPRVTLADLRGHPAAVNFWASWCEPCRKEAPHLDALAHSLPKGARLVGVDWSDGISGAEDFIKQYRWRFPTLRDADGTVGDRYGIRGLPTTFILTSDGRIAQTLRGPQDAATIRQALAATD
jgi:cytochrome c biogenesis protein CcmG, thiol:disulfide interchange protein DsbE